MAAHLDKPAQDPIGTVQDQMVTQFTGLSNNIREMNEKIDSLRVEVTGINSALSFCSTEATRNENGIAELKRDLNALLYKSIPGLEEQVAAAVTKQLQQIGNSGGPEIARDLARMNEELERVRDAMSNNAQSPNVVQKTRSASTPKDEERQYWWARKCMRCSPVEADSEAALWDASWDFLWNVLNIPKTELHSSAIQEVHRVSVRNEVLIVYDSIETRDIVASYAPNLSEWRQIHGKASIRLEIPAHLAGVFRVLDRHCHNLKNQEGNGARRSIKYDDIGQTLFMDFFPKEKEWVRIDYEEAAAATRVRACSNRPRANKPCPEPNPPTPDTQ